MIVSLHVDVQKNKMVKGTARKCHLSEKIDFIFSSDPKIQNVL